MLDNNNNLIKNLKLNFGKNSKKGQGGQGGSILIYCEEISGSGEISATGGDGIIGGEGGSINVIANKNNFSGKINVSGGKTIKK
jgi:hypothetical protein